ncbi:MAG: hypothetical protein II309_04555 [Bacilli bacterium]|nr:hypothetical protein [Bacilli bacterium]
MGKLLHTKRRATLTVTSNNTNYGTVSGGGIRRPRPYTTTITATPQTGYSFVSWNDGDISPNRTITVIDNINYVALFAILQQYNLIFDVDPDDYGKLYYSIFDSNGTRKVMNNTTTITSLSKNNLPSGYTITCDASTNPGYERDCWDISGCSFFDNTGPYSLGCNLNNFTTNSDSTVKLKFRETSLSTPEIPTNTYTDYLSKGVPVGGFFNMMSIESNSTPIYLAPANLILSKGSITETMNKVIKNCLENSGPTGTQMGLVINNTNNGFITVGGQNSNQAYPVKISDGKNGNSFTINIAFRLQSPDKMTFQYNNNGKLTTLEKPDGINSNYALISSNNYSTLSSFYKLSEVYDGKSYSETLNPGYWMLAINQTANGLNYIMFKYHNVTKSQICYLFSDYTIPIDNLDEINYITLTCLDSGSGTGYYSLYLNGSQISLTAAINDGKTNLGHPLDKANYNDVITLPLNYFNKIQNYSTINLGVNERGGGYLSSGLVIYKYSILPQHSTIEQVQVMCDSFFNGKSTHIMK